MDEMVAMGQKTVADHRVRILTAGNVDQPGRQGRNLTPAQGRYAERPAMCHRPTWDGKLRPANSQRVAVRAGEELGHHAPCHVCMRNAGRSVSAFRVLS